MKKYEFIYKNHPKIEGRYSEILKNIRWVRVDDCWGGIKLTFVVDVGAVDCFIPCSKEFSNIVRRKKYPSLIYLINQMYDIDVKNDNYCIISYGKRWAFSQVKFRNFNIDERKTILSGGWDYRHARNFV